MRAASFRDILSKLLEENNQSSPPAPSRNQMPIPPNPSQLYDFAFVFLDQPNLKNGRKYQNHTSNKTSQAPTNSRPKVQIHLTEKGQHAREALLRLGAVEIEDELSKTILKKAYRRLLKFYHPDHCQLDLTPELQSQRIDQFYELRNAYFTLEIELDA